MGCNVWPWTGEDGREKIERSGPLLEKKRELEDQESIAGNSDLWEELEKQRWGGVMEGSWRGTRHCCVRRLFVRGGRDHVSQEEGIRTNILQSWNMRQASHINRGEMVFTWAIANQEALCFCLSVSVSLYLSLCFCLSVSLCFFCVFPPLFPPALTWGRLFQLEPFLCIY